MEDEELIQQEALDFASSVTPVQDEFTEQYNRPGSITTGISEEKVEDYARLNVPLTEDSKAQWDKRLGENQAWTEQVLNGAGQIIAKLPATVIQNFASLADADMIFRPDPSKIENSLYESMEKYKESIDESIPIYRSNPGESFAFGDPGWWWKNISGTIESAAAFVISSYMTGAAVGKTLTGIYRGGRYAAAALKGKDAANLTAAIGTKASKSIQTIGAIINSATSNHMEGFGVATQVAKSAKQYALSQGKTEEEANKIAAESAAIAYNTNQFNILLNITSAGAFMTAPRHTRQLLKEMTVMGGLKNIGIEAGQEALEESVNNIAEKRAMAYAKGKNYGTNEAMSDMFSEEGLESAFWGAIGGAGQTALTGSIKAIPRLDANGNRTSAMTVNNERYAKQQETISKYNEVAKANGLKEFTAAFQDTVEFNKTMDSLQEAIKNNDKDSITKFQNLLVQHQAFEAFEMGTTKKLIDMYESIGASEAQEGMDNDPESDNYYKKQAKRAVDKIKALEDSYIDSDMYLNSKVVFKNRANKLETEDTLSKLKKEKLEAEVKVNTLLIDKNQELLSKDMPLIRDGIATDTKTLTLDSDEIKNSNEVKRFEALKEAVVNTESLLKTYDKEYDKLTSPKEQNKVKAEIERAKNEVKKLEQELKKANVAEDSKNLVKEAVEKEKVKEEIVNENIPVETGEVVEDAAASDPNYFFQDQDVDNVVEEEEKVVTKEGEGKGKDEYVDGKKVVGEFDEDYFFQEDVEQEIIDSENKDGEVVKKHAEGIDKIDNAGVYSPTMNKAVDEAVIAVNESLKKVNAVPVGEEFEYTAKPIYAPDILAYLTRDYEYVNKDGEVKKQDIDDKLLESFNTALIDLKVGDSIELRAYDNDDVPMMYNGESTTWGVAKVTADPVEHMPIAAYVNDEIVAYLHLPSWITPDNVDDRVVPLERQIEDLRKFRKSIIESPLKTKVSFKSNGNLIRTHDGSYNPTSVLGDVPFALVKGGELVKSARGEDQEVINNITLPKNEGMLSVLIPTDKGSIAAPVRRNKTSEEHAISMIKAVEIWWKSQNGLSTAEDDAINDDFVDNGFQINELNGTNGLAEYLRRFVYFQHLENGNNGSQLLAKLKGLESDVVMFGADSNTIYWGIGGTKKLQFINKKAGDKINEDAFNDLLANLQRHLMKSHINANFLFNQEGKMALPIFKDDNVSLINDTYDEFLKKHTSTNLLKFDVNNKPLYTIQPVISVKVPIPTKSENENENESVDEDIKEPTKSDEVEELDSFYEEAVEAIKSNFNVTVSSIQKKFKVNQVRAKKIIAQLEANNIIGPYKRGKKREILIDKKDVLENNETVEDEITETTEAKKKDIEVETTTKKVEDKTAELEEAKKREEEEAKKRDEELKKAKDSSGGVEVNKKGRKFGKSNKVTFGKTSTKEGDDLPNFDDDVYTHVDSTLRHKYIIKGLNDSESKSLVNFLVYEINAEVIRRNKEGEPKVSANEIMNAWKVEFITQSKDARLEGDRDLHKSLNRIIDNWQSVSYHVTSGIKRTNTINLDIDNEMKAQDKAGGDLEKKSFKDGASMEVDSKKTISAKLKLELTSVADVIIEDGEYVQDEGWLNMPKTVPFDTVYNTLSEHLEGQKPDYDTLISILEAKAPNIPFFKGVVQILNDADDDTKAEFVVAMTKHYIDMRQVVWELDKDGKYNLSVFESNAHTVAKTVQRAWNNDVQNEIFIPDPSDPNEYIIDEVLADSLIGEYKDLLSKAAVDKTVPSPDDMREWLSAVGIEVEDKVWSALIDEGLYYSKKNKKWKQFFIKGGLFNNIYNTLVRHQPVTKIVDGVEEKVYLKASDSDLTSNSAIKALSTLQARFSPSFTSNSFRNGENKTVFSYTQNKYLVNRFRDLKGEDLQKILSDLAFSKNSSWLNKMQDSESTFKDVFKLFYFDSLKENDRKGKTAGDMSPTEQELMRIGLFQNKGSMSTKSERVINIVYPTTSDKKVPYAMSVIANNTILRSNGDVNKGTIDAIYNSVVLPEIERILQWQKNKGKFDLKGYEKGAGMFLFMPELNTLDIYDENGDLDSNLLVPEVGDDKRSLIKDKINEYVNKSIDGKLEEWKELGITKDKFTDKTYMSDVANDNIRFAAADFITNTMIANGELFQLFIGDPAVFYKSKAKTTVDGKFDRTNTEAFIKASKDTFANIGKRLAGDIAPGVELANSTNNKFKTLFINDRKSMSYSFSYLTKLLDGKKYNPSHVTEDDIKSNYPLASEYATIEGTDAQEYTTLAEHLYVMKGLGKIKEENFNNLISRIKKEGDNLVLTEEEITDILQPMKPVYVANKIISIKNDQGADIPVTEARTYIKSSSFPLLPEMTKGLELDKLRKFMEGNKIDRATFGSAAKVGATAKLVDLFKKDGSITIPETALESVREYSREGFRIQQEVPFKESKKEVSDGTQQRKLLFSNILNVSGFKYKDVNFENLKRELDGIESNLIPTSKLGVEAFLEARINEMIEDEVIKLDCSGSKTYKVK